MKILRSYISGFCSNDWDQINQST